MLKWTVTGSRTSSCSSINSREASSDTADSSVIRNNDRPANADTTRCHLKNKNCCWQGNENKENCFHPFAPLSIPLHTDRKKVEGSWRKVDVADWKEVNDGWWNDSNYHHSLYDTPFSSDPSHIRRKNHDPTYSKNDYIEENDEFGRGEECRRMAATIQTSPPEEEEPHQLDHKQLPTPVAKLSGSAYTPLLNTMAHLLNMHTPSPTKRKAADDDGDQGESSNKKMRRQSSITLSRDCFLTPGQHNSFTRQKAIRRKNKFSSSTTVPPRTTILRNRVADGILPSPFHFAKDSQLTSDDRLADGAAVLALLPNSNATTSPLVLRRSTNERQHIDLADSSMLSLSDVCQNKFSTPISSSVRSLLNLSDDIFLSPLSRINTIFDSINKVDVDQDLTTGTLPSSLPPAVVISRFFQSTTPTNEESLPLNYNVFAKGETSAEKCIRLDRAASEKSVKTLLPDGMSTALSFRNNTVSNYAVLKATNLNVSCKSNIASADTCQMCASNPCCGQQDALYIKVNLIDGCRPDQRLSRLLHRTEPRSRNRYLAHHHHHRSCCCHQATFHNEVFTFEVDRHQNEHQRVLFSVWHHSPANTTVTQKSQFLGCMSFAIKNILKKQEVRGSYKLLSSSNNTKSPPSPPPVHYLQSQGFASSTSSSHHQPDETTTTTTTTTTSHEKNSSTDSNATSSHVTATTATVVCASNSQQCHPENADKETAMTMFPSITTSSKVLIKNEEDYLFLQHLELDPIPMVEPSSKGQPVGRTPFTITFKLHRQPNSSYGFSIAWTHPPRVERVECNSAAHRAGLLAGDMVVFVNVTNVVTLSENSALEIIRSCGNQLSLEIYRRKESRKSVQSQRSISGGDIMNKVKSGGGGRGLANLQTHSPPRRPPSLLHLSPQITFSSEEETWTAEDSFSNNKEGSSSLVCRLAMELLKKEQQFALCMQFGISRFLLPLAERIHLLSSTDHQSLFQNVQQLLRITEDILEQLMPILIRDGSSEGEDTRATFTPTSDLDPIHISQLIVNVYTSKSSWMIKCYRSYCCGLKRADCLLVQKTRCPEFVHLLQNPPIPPKRPDLVSFIHKPLQHYRDVLKLLQLVYNCKMLKDDQQRRTFNNLIIQLQKAGGCAMFQETYRDITVESGLMDCCSLMADQLDISSNRTPTLGTPVLTRMQPSSNAATAILPKPILTLRDLESRLVFTKCKPFKLTTSGRKWIFAGDLSRIDTGGKVLWVLLFSDLILFTKINRDRVVFVTDEPLPLANVLRTRFDIKKKETEFRLMVGGEGMCSWNERTEDEQQMGCMRRITHRPTLEQGRGAIAHISWSIRKHKLKTFIFRAPSAELKAVWQNLIQTQIIKINTKLRTDGEEIASNRNGEEQTDGTGTGNHDSWPSEQLDNSFSTSSNNNYLHQQEEKRNRKIYGKKEFARKMANHIIEEKCRKLSKDGKNGLTKNRAFHMAEWIKAQNVENAADASDKLESASAEDAAYCNGHHSQQLADKTDNEGWRGGEVAAVYEVCARCASVCAARRQQSEAQAFLDHLHSRAAAATEEEEEAKRTKEASFTPTQLFSPLQPYTPTTADEIKESLEKVIGWSEATGRTIMEKKGSEESSGSGSSVPYKSFLNEDEDDEEEFEDCQSGSLKRFVSMSNLSAMEEGVDERNDYPFVESEPGHQEERSWAGRATAYFAQKIGLYEMPTRLSKGADVELSSTSQSLKLVEVEDDEEDGSNEAEEEEEVEDEDDDCGGELWATPKSTGTYSTHNSEMSLSPTTPPPYAEQEEDEEELEQVCQLEDEQNRLLENTFNLLAQQQQATCSLSSGSTPNRLLHNKTRLETLPEDGEDDLSPSSPSSTISIVTTSSDCTLNSTNPSNSWQGKGRKLVGSYESEVGGSSSIFNAFKLILPSSSSTAASDSTTVTSHSIRRGFNRWWSCSKSDQEDNSTCTKSVSIKETNDFGKCKRKRRRRYEKRAHKSNWKLRGLLFMSKSDDQVNVSALTEQPNRCNSLQTSDSSSSQERITDEATTIDSKIKFWKKLKRRQTT